MNILECEHILETYTFQDILEENELTEADVLLFLLEQEFVKIPGFIPL